MKTKRLLLFMLAVLPMALQAQMWTDVTDVYVVNPSFDNNSNEGWTCTADGAKLQNSTMEYWNTSSFDIHQTVNVPNGRYRLTVNAFYRGGSDNIAAKYHEYGTESVTGTLYANDAEQLVSCLHTVSFSYEDVPSQDGFMYFFSGNDMVYYVNQLPAASNLLNSGYYVNTMEVEVTDGTLTFGLRDERSASELEAYGDIWCVFDNFKLEVYDADFEVIPTTEIQLSESTKTLLIGETLSLTATVLPENATYRQLNWTSSNPAVASVDDNGNVAAVEAGSAVITVSSRQYPDISAQCRVTVSAGDAGSEASLIINEVQSCNIDMFVDPSFNYGGWIELYNPTNQAISLYGLYVSDDTYTPMKYRLNRSHGTVPAKGYKTIWFGHYEADQSQVNFKLDYDGGVIVLSDANGATISSVTYPVGVTRTSYARNTDGGETWGYTANPTPAASNASSVFATEVLPAPVVDRDACLFDAGFSVNVTIPEGTTLRYTTDGTTPTMTNGLTSTNGSFNVQTTTTYRFRLFQDGKLPSKVVTRSYLKRDKDYYLPVISVVTDPDHLYDDSLGIQVKGVNGRPGNGQSTACNWNMDWDRPVNFEYITADGEMVINQEVDMSAVGGWSRASSPHSFKLKAKKVYEGENFYAYPLFPDKPFLKHKTLQIRNGGNHTDNRIKDAVLTSIVASSGIDIDCQAYQATHVFQNGDYIGLLNMREPNNKDFAYANFGYDDAELDQWEMSPDSGYVQKEGDRVAFERWYALSANAANESTYAEICNLVDIDEYVNYMACEYFLGSMDWMRNNIKSYRPRWEGGKFRFVLFDTDGALSGNIFGIISNWQNYTFDTLYPGGTRLTKEIEMQTILYNMMQNATFRKKFVDTFCLMAGSVFEDTRVARITDSIANNVSTAMGWEGYYSSVMNMAGTIKSTLSQFRTSQISNMQNFSRLQVSARPQNVKIAANTGAARLLLNDMPIPTGKFDGKLFGPITLKAEAPAGYRFAGWWSAAGSGNNNGNSNTGISLLEKGTAWKYYDQGSLDGENWTSEGYDASGWSTGMAPLGFASSAGVFNTVLSYGDNSNSKHPTYYFRRDLNLTEAPTTDLTFNFDIDDGIVIYVNGTEVHRFNMPSGTISFNTFASSYFNQFPMPGSATISASYFKRGNNVIAVEVHNNSAVSSDIYFDASIVASSTQGGGSTDVERTLVCETPEYNMNLSTTQTLNSGYDVEARFERLSDEELLAEGIRPVVINEVGAANSIYINDILKKNDWIELYNTTSEAIDVAGMYLSDDPANPQKWQIPAGDVMVPTIIEPNGFLIVWADNKAGISQLHSNFKLAAEGGSVMLMAEDQSWSDTLYYPLHNGDQSVGLFPDGGSAVYTMNLPTLNASNRMSSYAVYYEEPVVDTGIVTSLTRNSSLSLSLQKHAAVLVCSENSGTVNYNIFNTASRQVASGDVNLVGGTASIDLSALPKGVYLVRVSDAEGNVCTMKVMR